LLSKIVAATGIGYLEGGASGQDFKAYKSYQLFVYKKDAQGKVQPAEQY
jgi:hypothetical protein